MLREGEGPPLVLLHGILGSERMWRHVVPLLASHHDTIALTLLGHRGGPAQVVRPARLEHLIDDVERQLDELGLGKVHLAGNSLGGWIGLELVRRGRAESLCALSPAGMWELSESSGHLPKRVKILSATIRDTRRGRPLLPLLARSARFRRWGLRNTAVHGERVTPAEMVSGADDVIGCAVGEELLNTPNQLPPLEESSCPITIAWSGEDRIFPLHEYRPRAQALVPDARFIVLDGLGHVPMFDDPQVVAQTILGCTGGGAPSQGSS